MGTWKRFLVQVVWGGLFVSGSLGAVLPIAAQQATIPEKRERTAPVDTKLTELPDSPGMTLAQSQAPPSPQTAQPQSSTSQTPPPAQKPVGTAAAGAPTTSGVAASEPAGVAIAPAKQRRARTIVIRVGAIIGAGVAVGSVVALTAGTSSKPPGAH
jgi:cytoskeletal protein RodZ